MFTLLAYTLINEVRNLESAGVKSADSVRAREHADARLCTAHMHLLGSSVPRSAAVLVALCTVFVDKREERSVTQSHLGQTCVRFIWTDSTTVLWALLCFVIGGVHVLSSL